MTDENASLPPAGWYPDPEVAGGERWWDGSAWSTHQRAATAAPEPEPAVAPPTAPEAPAAPAAPAFAYVPSQAPAASPYVAPPVYGAGAPGYGAPGYGTPAPAYGYGAAQPSNVTALIGLILSIVGVALGWILTFLSLAAVAGLVVSIIGLRTASRMRAEGNPNHRWGLALAGVIIGGVGILIGAILVVAAIVYYVQYLSYF